MLRQSSPYLKCSTAYGVVQLLDLRRASIFALLPFDAIRRVECFLLSPETGRKEKSEKKKPKEQERNPNTT